MGFREGEGLGKYGQGRKDIVEASNQKGRRGFGLTLKGFDGELNIDWQDEPEVSTLCFKSHFSCYAQQKLGERMCKASVVFSAAVSFPVSLNCTLSTRFLCCLDYQTLIKGAVVRVFFVVEVFGVVFNFKNK